MNKQNKYRKEDSSVEHIIHNRSKRRSKSRRPLKNRHKKSQQKSHKKNDVSFKFKSNKYNVLTYDPKKELPTTNPFDAVDYKFWTKKWWSSFLHTYDPKKWEPYVKDVMSYYLPKLKKVNDVYFIPKGTLLYHSSDKSDISEYNNKRLTFFGFDANISIWYTLEMMLNNKYFNKPVPKHYYLHEFKLDNDIRITKLWNTMLKNPGEVKECRKYDSVCVHPQLVFHGMSINTEKHELYDLSLEVTLFVKKYINSVLKQNRLFLVDPLILNKNSNNKNFIPSDHITLVNNNNNNNNNNRKVDSSIYHFMHNKSKRRSRSRRPLRRSRSRRPLRRSRSRRHSKTRIHMSRKSITRKSRRFKMSDKNDTKIDAERIMRRTKLVQEGGYDLNKYLFNEMLGPAFICYFAYPNELVNYQDVQSMVKIENKKFRNFDIINSPSGTGKVLKEIRVVTGLHINTLTVFPKELETISVDNGVKIILSGYLTEKFSYFLRFDCDVSSWDTSRVTNMCGMFRGSTKFTGKGIEKWDTSGVDNMNGMFSGATSFNGYVGNWDTSGVTNMGSMFYDAKNFNRPIGNWNTSKVTDMGTMFYNATNFNGPLNTKSVTINENTYTAWDVSGVTNMYAMFSGAKNFNKSINKWNTSKVTSMCGMFIGAENFNQPIGNWNTSEVTDMSYMFMDAINFNKPINKWNTSKVSYTHDMFRGASKMKKNNKPRFN